MDTTETVFKHDGTFTGLICAAEAAFKHRAPFAAVPRLLSERDKYLKEAVPEQADLFDSDPSPALSFTTDPANTGLLPMIEVKSNPALARRFADILKARACPEALQMVFSAWHSDYPALDEPATVFMAACIDRGAASIGNLTDPFIGKLTRAAQRANREKHLFMGLVRFRLLSDGTYYAPINPDCDVLPLLVGHFRRRFFNQDWIIHDVHRGKALFHKKAGATEGIMIDAIEGMDLTVLKKGGELPEKILAPTEKAVQAAFRLYYNDISIPERKNTAVQRGHMPKKYWLHLVEKADQP